MHARFSCKPANLDSIGTFNDLLLNPNKSEAIVIGTKPQLNTQKASDTINVSGAQLSIQNDIKILGFTIDQELSLKQHVSAVVQACNYHIWALRHIRNCLPLDLAKIIACSIVGSRLDYCNSLLLGTSKANIQKLQRAQHNLARVVLQQPRRTHAEPLLKQLHWLPINQRIQYKTAVLTHRAHYTQQPAYLSDLLSARQPTRCTRATEYIRFHQPIASSQTAGRGFQFMAPTIWNNLPETVRADTSEQSFKSKLKTHLFSVAYNC